MPPNNHLPGNIQGTRSRDPRRKFAGAARKVGAAPAGTMSAPHCPETTRSKLWKRIFSACGPRRQGGIGNSTATGGTILTGIAPPTSVQTNARVIHDPAVLILSPTTPFKILPRGQARRFHPLAPLQRPRPAPVTFIECRPPHCLVRTTSGALRIRTQTGTSAACTHPSGKATDG